MEDTPRSEPEMPHLRRAADPQLVERLVPLYSDYGQARESPDEYVLRVAPLLPNFPNDVLVQWFCENEDVAKEYSWMDYQSLSFSLARFSTSELALPCLSRNETVAQYRDHFTGGSNASAKMARIADFMAEHGTWPRAPVMLSNPRGDILPPWGAPYASPYQLLEGHHRMAVLYALAEQGEVVGPHDVWLVALKSAQGADSEAPRGSA